MTQEEKVQYWLGIADEDYVVAGSLMSAKHWLYVAFMCHQVIEKTLKAYWSATREDIPPFIHNHKRLAEGVGLYEQMNENQKDFINAIAAYNIEARYPDYKSRVAASLNEKVCKDLMEQTKELQLWIKSKL